ncbi:methylenetetrahydrofolate reductase [Kineococcus gynurae]|uniref:Methylenetetrahydrofolate reductase n=1 Tax=Kineococcus gynurae TaxID=452979 RepID=A0ABV5LW97_9ACTN
MTTGVRPGDLLADFSLEITGKDLAALAEAGPALPAGTRVNVTHLGSEDQALRVSAARALVERGYVAVPHISARRLTSSAQLAEFLQELSAVGANREVFVVGGDPTTPEGPFADSLAVIGSGLLAEHGVERVGISAYPEGHPGITDPVLWEALSAKTAALREQGLAGNVITQFGFDAETVLAFLAAARARGIDLPVRVGVPGPAGIRRLTSYAARLGVSTSAGIARKYGLSLTNLLGTAGPDRFVRALAQQLDPAVHGDVALHLYTFGGVRAAAEWAREFRDRS